MARDIAQEIIDAVQGGAADYVITKLAQERESKIAAQGLAGSVPSTDTILKTAYAKAGSGYSSSGGRSSSGGGQTISNPDPAPAVTNPAPAPAPSAVNNIDPNGIVSVSGYDPAQYTSTMRSSAGSGEGSKIAGFFVLGLVVVVILDKLMK